jgi:ribonuclease E
MAKKLLIDAKQPEETRVVLLNGNRIEDFDQETTTKLQNKGNIYLARVTRVEPSLQAAFVEYGGTKHGFLAFSEIHPDYYRIPVEDRKALTEEMIKAKEPNLDEKPNLEIDKEIKDSKDLENNDDQNLNHSTELLVVNEKKEKPEVISEEDDTNSINETKIFKRYKIQEVISKRQILLVQVAKEERGNKGAALTTYISLAGRYCVLMPNTIKGGGVSRKISKIEDRKRLKSIIEEMKMPEGMAVIIRTAGSDRTKAELKKDFTYLQNLWDTIREKTIKSTAPILINEEGNLIKRTIRDLYDSNVNEILVSGENAYNTAKSYMKEMLPSQIKRVKAFKDTKNSIFQKYNVEKQLDSMYLPSVKLKSGGYIVINQTEALVAIDVNSGRATKERNIEETALSTNIEAAEEVARQLKLRDLSGLIVIDFIDMEGYKNQHSVERKLKEAMSSDRARIQIGRISHFGLLELSRQRLRPSVSENYFSACDTCGGTGVVRSVESSALRVLRKIEDTNIRNELLNIFVPSIIGMYILNQKRKSISEIEEKLNISINFQFDDQDNDLDCKIEKKGPFKIEELSEVKNYSEKLEEEQEQKNETKKIRKNSWKKTKTKNTNKKDNQELINKNEEKISNLNINLKDKEKKDEIAKEQIEKDDKNSLKKISKENVKGKNKTKASKTNKQIEEKETNSKNEKAKTSSAKNESLNKKNGITDDKSKKTVKEKKRVSKASQPLKVVNVDEVKEAKKGGWWSQAK